MKNELMRSESAKSKRTTDFLLCISKHLSSRKSLRSYNYIVKIDGDRVSFDPPVQVYPSIHHRKRESKVGIIEHVVMGHFYHDVFSYSDHTGLHIQEGSLVDGTYNYESSLDNRRRRWCRTI